MPGRRHLFSSRRTAYDAEADFSKACFEQIHEIAGGELTSLDAFIASLVQWRGRPITRLVLSEPTPTPVSLLFSDREADYMLLSRGLSTIQDIQFSGHESAHLVCEHEGETATSEDLAALRALLPPTVDLVGSVQMFRRTTYAARPERQAEIFGSVLTVELTRLGGDLWSGGGPGGHESLQSLFGTYRPR